MTFVTVLDGPRELGFERLHPDVRAYLERASADDLMECLIDTLLADGAYLWQEDRFGKHIWRGVDVYARMPDGTQRRVALYLVDKDDEDEYWEVNTDVWDIIERVRAAANEAHRRRPGG